LCFGGETAVVISMQDADDGNLRRNISYERAAE
jgi:hypothetical protein